jgi:putative tryptophan/tyrosine transport system substrate-binding protein
LTAGLVLLSGMVRAETQKVGVMWSENSGMAERVLEGFLEFIKDKAPDVDIEIKKNLPDLDTVAIVYEKFQKEKDAVVFLRSSGVKYLIKHPPTKPTFIGACTNPVSLGLLKSLDKPTGNITGVTYYIPIKSQLKVLKLIFPKLKRIGHLLEDGHPSSDIEKKETMDACSKFHFEYSNAKCANTDDLKIAVADLLEKKPDCIIIGNQNLLMDNASTIAEYLGDIPLISYAENPIISKAALLGLVPDDHKLGKMLANRLVLVLQSGRKTTELPIATDPNPRLTINMPLAKKLGLTIPSSLLSHAKKIE